MYTLPIKELCFFCFYLCIKKFIIQEIDDIFLDHSFLITCLANYKNIDDIYYPKNCENLHNKTNDILV